jgi:GntR family transcriptional regulator / MocR family aminotransferase
MGLHVRGLDFALPPREEGAPATRWLRDSLRRAIIGGAIPPESRIPSSRELARAYGLARGTIVAAMDDLRAEGYLNGIRGSGIYVCRSLPNGLLENPVPVKRGASGAAITEIPLTIFSRRVRAYSHHASLNTKAFRTNLPALDRFPSSLWARTMSRCLRRVTVAQLVSGSPGGYRDLRSAVAEYLTTSRGANCDSGQVIIVSGVREAIDLTARLIVDPGDRVLVEDPGYQGSYAAFQAAGATLIPIPVDAEGAAPSAEQFHAARLLYLTPGHQFPTGVTMSAVRRLDILNRAGKAGAYIFEDDYDSEYRYTGSPLPVLQGLDRNQRVILAGSFNKTMFPALRLGYVVLPRHLVEPFLHLKALSHVQSIADQMAFLEFLREGYFARHLRQMRRLYAARYSALSENVAVHLSEYLTLSPIQAGLQTVGWLRAGISGQAVTAEAASQNIDVVPLSCYSHCLTIPQGIQLGFAAIDEESIELGVKSLAVAIRRVLKNGAGKAQL